MIKILTVGCVLAVPWIGSARVPEPVKGPEIWLEVLGGNLTKAGLTADLEAIAEGGFSGIHFFHIERDGLSWPGVTDPIPCMSAKWDDVMTHLGRECQRLGLRLTIQNCPGWSQSGGPWIRPEHAMRDIKVARTDVGGGAEVVRVPVPSEFRSAEDDWRDVAVLAFPTPTGDDGTELRPVSVETNGVTRTFSFAQPVTIRTIVLPGPKTYNRAYAYNEPWLHVRLEAENADGGWEESLSSDLPVSSWRDYVETLSIACAEKTARRWRYTLTHDFPVLSNPSPQFFSAARQTNWEMKSARVLRSLMRGVAPRQSASAWVDERRLVDLTDRLQPDDTVDWKTPAGGPWTVLRFGHVNAKRVNAPAPKEATGWECDKLAREGIEEHFKGYVARLADGPLRGGLLQAMLVDSWECFGQTWTPKMEAEFSVRTGYPLRRKLPALFGWVLGNPERTELFLRDWRETVSSLITENYYGRMAELAHENGLGSLYETAFGDCIPGDLLAYWKYCDAPMCEFWYPFAPKERGDVASDAYKSVRPCASAAHVYGKRRVIAESFTEWGFDWRESPQTLKALANRYFARGVTHVAACSYVHNPMVVGLPPGATTGYNGTPFSRFQTWWKDVPRLTRYLTLCEERLETGRPVADVLWYLGDAYDHKPDVNAAFPEGHAYDYVNRDVLFNRLSVRDGAFVIPEGTSWRVLWVPDEYLLRPETRTRLKDLAAAGGRVVFGDRGALRQALAGIVPDVMPSPRLGDAPSEDLYWCHRVSGGTNTYFVAAGTNGFSGSLSFRAGCVARVFDPVREVYERWEGGSVSLAPGESRFFEFAPTADAAMLATAFVKAVGTCQSLTGWTVSFPGGWGADSPWKTDRAASWSTAAERTREERAFCGTAAYETTFDLSSGGRVLLDLGQVETVASVFLNGRPVRTLWCAPYSCDVSDFVLTGANRLRVEVTNTWRNRLVYDAGLPESVRKTWLLRNRGFCPEAEDPFVPAGLLGPVALWTAH